MRKFLVDTYGMNPKGFIDVDYNFGDAYINLEFGSIRWNTCDTPNCPSPEEVFNNLVIRVGESCTIGANCIADSAGTAP